MNDKRKRVYVVEDSVASGTLYCSFLESAGFEAELYKDGKSAMIAIGQDMPDVIIQDVSLPDVSGLEVLAYAKRKNPAVPVIVITANSSLDIAVEALRSGGFDFIEKPFDKERLVQSALSATQEIAAQMAIPDREKKVAADVEDLFIGDSLPMKYVYKVLKSAAKSKASVFVTGESGTGKELCAQAVHRAGARANGPFIAINCAAIPSELFESEIFGHVKGAFTGALNDRKGAAEMANSGTLFLDELCEMPLPLQAKLLRFIQTGKYTPVGAAEERHVDVRFVCATNRDPAQEVADGNFREDLFYRLNVVPVHLPPLRDRGHDVITIARHILADKARENDKDFADFSDQSITRLLSYDWPGNIRELQNIIEKAVVINSGHSVELDMLSFQSGPSSPVQSQSHVAHAPQPILASGAAIQPLWVVEKQAIEQAIHLCGDNIPLAAACLGVSASTIYRKKKQWEDGTN